MAFRKDRHPETAPFPFHSCPHRLRGEERTPPAAPDRPPHNSIWQTRECVWPAPAQQPGDRLALSVFAWFWAGAGKWCQWIIITVRGEFTVQTARHTEAEHGPGRPALRAEELPPETFHEGHRPQSRS